MCLWGSVDEIGLSRERLRDGWTAIIALDLLLIGSGTQVITSAYFRIQIQACEKEAQLQIVVAFIYNDRAWNYIFIHFQQFCEIITIYMLAHLASQCQPARSDARLWTRASSVRAWLATSLPTRVFHFFRENLWRPTLIVIVKFCNIHKHIYWVSVKLLGLLGLC